MSIKKIKSNELYTSDLGWRTSRYHFSFADYHDPHNFFADAQWNRFSDQEHLWDHPEYNRLIQKAKGVMDQQERIDLYQQADRLVVEEAPLIPLSYGGTHGLQKPWVKGLTVRAAQIAYFKEVIIEEH
jgi:ABC-type transport system substrate-binding protein